MPSLPVQFGTVEQFEYPCRDCQRCCWAIDQDYFVCRGPRLVVTDYFSGTKLYPYRYVGEIKEFSRNGRTTYKSTTDEVIEQGRIWPCVPSRAVVDTPRDYTELPRVVMYPTFLNGVVQPYVEDAEEDGPYEYVVPSPIDVVITPSEEVLRSFYEAAKKVLPYVPRAALMTDEGIGYPASWLEAVIESYEERQSLLEEIEGRAI